MSLSHMAPEVLGVGGSGDRVYPFVQCFLVALQFRKDPPDVLWAILWTLVQRVILWASVTILRGHLIGTVNPNLIGTC